MPQDIYSKAGADAATSAAINALGLGTAATKDVGTTAGTVKAGDYQPAADDVTDSTAAGRALLKAADAAAQRTSLGLGTAAAHAHEDYATAEQGALASGAPQKAANLSDLASPAAARVNLGLDSRYAYRPTTYVVGFGDSHMQGVESKQGGGSAWIAERPYSQAPFGQSLFAWGLAMCDGAARFAGNFGVGGERTDQIAARVGDVIASGAKVCVLQMGTNDARQAYSLDHTKTYYTQTVDALRSAGMTVIVTGLPPINDATTVRDAVDKINAWLQYYCACSGIPYVDAYSDLVNQADRTILADSNVDGVHYSATGAQRIGQRLGAALRTLCKPVQLPLALSNVDATNLLPNALALTDTNADGVPDGWSTIGTPTAGSIVQTLETIDGWSGKAMAVEHIGSNNDRQLTTSTNISAGKWAPGDVMRVSFRLRHTRATPGVGGDGALFRVNFEGASVPPGGNSIIFNTLVATTADLLVVYDFKVPPGATTLGVTLLCMRGTSKTWLGQPTLVNVTKLTGVTSLPFA